MWLGEKSPNILLINENAIYSNFEGTVTARLLKTCAYKFVSNSCWHLVDTYCEGGEGYREI